MPIVAIAIGFVGSAIGTAVGGVIGGIIGAGIAGGVMAAVTGGSFGQGFLMGAVGSVAGQFLSGGIGSLGNTAATDAGTSASGMFGEAGSGISSAGTSGASTATGLGEVASGAGTGFGEIGQAANSTGNMFDAGTYNVGGGGASSGLGEATGNALGMPSTLNTGVTDLANNPLTNGGFEGTSPNNPLGSVMPSGSSPVGTVTSPMNSNIGFNTQPSNDSYSLMNPQPAQAGSSMDTSGGALEGGTGTTPTEGTPSSGIRGAIDSGNNWIRSNLGINNAINSRSLMGVGQYLTDRYEQHKLEQQAKGLEPLSFEQYRQQYSDPGAYKTASNQLAKSGHTGTLPILLANMNQRARGAYAQYLPGARQTSLGVQGDLAAARSRSLSNMFRSFGTA
jgi:hypothetical protein